MAARIGSLQGILGELACPCVGGHPAPPPGKSGRPDATLSPGAKLLVSWYLHRCAEAGRSVPLARRRYPNPRDRGCKGAGQRGFADRRPRRDGNAWVNPQPAETARRLVLGGGFVVDSGRDRRLQERARWYVFEDLRGYLQARCDTGHSIPRIAAELGVGDWQVQAALSRLQVRRAPQRQRLAAQRRRYTEERIAARVAALGFAEVRAYLLDRVVQRGWLPAKVAAELGAHRVTVRRLLDRHGIRRVRRTLAERAATESGHRVQAAGWQTRRTARLAELGFQDLAAYLQARHVAQGWSVKRMRAELGVGRRWLVGELARLELRP